MKPNLVLIAPNESIAKVANNVIKDSDFNCRVVVGNLEQGVKLAQVAEKTGAEAIISRGGTFLAIQKAVQSTPLVQINVSAFDLLEALHQAAILKNIQTEIIGIVGYPNTIYDASSMGKILNLNIIEIHVENPRQLEQRLLEEAQKGLKYIVGDTISVNIAEKIGLEGILISSGKRAIFAALDRAEEMVILRRKEALAQSRFRAILDEFTEGILALDSTMNIIHSNPSVEKYLGCTAEQLIGKPIREIIPGFHWNEELVLLRDQQYLIGIQTIVCKGFPEAGYFLTLKPVLQLQETEARLRKKLHHRGLVAKHTLNDIVGESEEIRKVLDKAKKISRSNGTALIMGKTGVGKEMFAQGIHNSSPRANGPFVAVNCASFPESILESELFGYVAGSFTDARKGGKTGLFELAHGGTIFLDEIGDMSLSVQAKVLRVLQEREVIRLGDDRIIPVDIRIIAATNSDLWQSVQEGRFREDLYYRVNVLNLNIPALRERGGDVILLAETFFRKLAPKIKIEKNCFRHLLDYHWPGNVRELYNYVEQLAVLADGQVITEIDILEVLQHMAKPVLNELNPQITAGRPSDESILLILKKCRGNQSKASEMLGMNRTTLWRRLKKLGLD